VLSKLMTEEKQNPQVTPKQQRNFLHKEASASRSLRSTKNCSEKRKKGKNVNFQRCLEGKRRQYSRLGPLQKYFSNF
jgi:hypothetical protein